MFNYWVKAALLQKSIYPIFKKTPEMVMTSLITVSLTGLSLSVAMKYSIPSDNQQESYLMMAVAFSTILVGWMLWSYLAKVICQILGTEFEFRDMMRCTGIAYSPGILFILTIVPIIKYIALPVVFIWLLLSVTRSIQSMQEVNLWKAFIPGLIGWFMSLILFPILMLGNYFYIPQ